MSDEPAPDGPASAWWAERERLYRARPEVRREIERIEEDWQRDMEEAQARLGRLEARAEAGIPGAERALTEAYVWDALETRPPEPSPMDDPEEWRAFFQYKYGRHMPVNAEYEAAKHRIAAAAPADVGRMAAAYYEANDITGFDHDDHDEMYRERHAPPRRQPDADLHPDELEAG